MGIRELVAACPPPARPTSPRGDWAAVAGRLCALPSDYRALVETYGTGTFGDLVWVWNPFEANRHLELVAAGAQTLEADRESRASFPDRFTMALHPEPGGLLPWGVTDNGDGLYWETTGAPDTWTVFVLPSRELAGERFAVGITDFLAGWLAGRIAPGAFGAASVAEFEPLRATKRVDVHFHRLAADPAIAADRAMKHLRKTKSKGKHIHPSGSQWHFLIADGDSKVTFNWQPEGYAQLWLTFPSGVETQVHDLVAAIPGALGWSIENIVTPEGRGQVDAWPDIPRAPKPPKAKARPSVKPKPKAKAKPRPKKKPRRSR
jgi:hypothetical protein